jgi:hypothetical protein
MTETHFAMVSEWMVNGKINEFVEAHPDADRLGLVGFPLNALSHFKSINDQIISLADRRRHGAYIHP